MRRAGLGVAALALTAQAAVAAAPAGPSASFPGETIQSLVAKIAAGCESRGFIVTRLGETDVICQAGDLDRKTPEFRAKGPFGNPQDTAGQLFHRFTVSAVEGGAHVDERSTMTFKFRDAPMQEIAPRLVFARIVNSRIEEFYQSLRQMPAPPSPAAPPAPPAAVAAAPQPATPSSPPPAPPAAQPTKPTASSNKATAIQRPTGKAPCGIRSLTNPDAVTCPK